MKEQSSRKTKKTPDWPQKATCGRVAVKVYHRITPGGNFAYMVSNYADGKRRFDCYATETEAMEEATKLAKRLSQRDVLAASMTREQAIEFASAAQTLQPFNLSLSPAVASVADSVCTCNLH